MFFWGLSCFGYFGYHSIGCLSKTPFSTLLDYSTNLARVSEEKTGKELKLIKGGYISEGIFTGKKLWKEKHGKFYRIRKSDATHFATVIYKRKKLLFDNNNKK